MKYFPYNLIAAANGWDASSWPAQARAATAFANAVSQYHAQLERLRGRVSQSAWAFFRHGAGERGLHDARLLSFAIGDGLSHAGDGSMALLRNRQSVAARLEFLNYEQTYRHAFEARGVRTSRLAFESDETGSIQQFGDLYTYELTASDEDTLGLGFLFADGAEIWVEFRKLVYRRERLDRRYDIGEIYG